MAKSAPKEIIEPISWLVGKWRSIKAHGEYPGIKPFDYCEEMEFKFFGQPLLNYSSKTWMLDEKYTLKHCESGYLKIKPNTNQLCFLVAHNFGLNSMEEGVVNGCEINLKSSEISRMSFARGPAVSQIERNYKLCDNKLEMILYMATSEKQLSKHLTVLYEKIEC